MLKPLCMYTEIEQWEMLGTRFLFLFSLLELEVIDKQGGGS